MPYERRNILSSLPPTGPVTKKICIAILSVSIAGAILGRKSTLGLHLLDYRLQDILHLELWRLITYPFVESTPFGLMLGTLIFWLFGSISGTTCPTPFYSSRVKDTSNNMIPHSRQIFHSSPFNHNN